MQQRVEPHVRDKGTSAQRVSAIRPMEIKQTLLDQERSRAGLLSINKAGLLAVVDDLAGRDFVRLQQPDRDEGCGEDLLEWDVHRASACSKIV